MRVHQFVHTLSYGDAISGEALAIKRLLLRAGFESKIYSVHAHELLKDEVTPFARFGMELGEAERAGEQTAVILHYSIGSPLNGLFLGAPNIARVMIYHNLTPEHWFLPYNPRVVADLIQGRGELPELLKEVDLVLADSEYNREELKSFGCEVSTVLPLLIDIEKWQVPANGGITAAVRGHGGRNILHVGRTAPNKCIQDIIKVFYFYHHKIEPKSKLWLIGNDIDTEIYSFELRRLVSELRLNDAVEFVGTVADGELRAFYEGADAYICMSEHEGFCVPLLEAMHFGVPVMAYNSTAVGDTLGDGGILLGRKSPAEVAELVNLVVTDNEMRAKLIAAGKKRVKDFSPEVFVANLEKVLIAPLKEHFSKETKLNVSKESSVVESGINNISTGGAGNTNATQALARNG